MASLGTKVVREVEAALTSGWLAAPSSLTISEDEVHVWKVDLRSLVVSDVEDALWPDEQDRAARFHFGKDRQQYKAAHCALRLILSRYLNLAPGALVFAQTEYGKPFVMNPEASGVLFNMSHSGELALIAVAREREVGIDVELIRADFATNEVAENFFSIAELYTLCGLDPDARTAAFFDCWTRKEAYVKARGEGLSMPLDLFDVSLGPGVPAAMLRNRVDESENSRWIFEDLQVAPGYAGAVVIEALRSEPHLSRFAFSC